MIIGESFFIYMLLMVWVACAALVVAGKARVFSPVQSGVPVAEVEMKWLYASLGIIFILMMIASVTKPEFLPDYNNYYLWYTKENYRETTEISFKIISRIAPTYVWLFAIYSFFSIGLKLLAIRRYSPCLWLSMLTWLSMWFVMHDLIQIRGALAGSIALMAIPYITERKALKYYVLIGLAMCFHYSAAIFLPFYFLSTERARKGVYYPVVILSFGLYFADVSMGHLAKLVPIGFVQNYVQSYLNAREFTFGGFGIVWITRVLFTLMVYWRIDTVAKKYPYAMVVVKIYIWSLLIYILFKDIPVMSGRLSEIVGVTSIFCYAMVPLTFPKIRHLLNIFMVIYILWISMTAVNMYTNPHYVEDARKKTIMLNNQ